MNLNTGVDIALVVPPLRVYSQVVPISLLYLASYLESKSIQCKIVDLKILKKKDYNLEKLENLIVDNTLMLKPLCVGFTCLTAEYFSVARMAKKLRANGYKGYIIAGGHHATFCPEDFFVEKGIFNYVILGEGEITTHELLMAISKNNDASQVEGIVFYDGTLHRTNNRELIEDLSILPMPNYSLLDMNYYLQPRVDLIRHILFSGIDIQTTRGCPFSCTFCGNHTLWSVHRYRKRFRVRTIEQVIREIEFLKDKYKIDTFYIQDDTFTVDEGRVKEFCDGIRKKNLNLIWGCQSHVNMFSEYIEKYMSESGCIQVEFGVESGSDRVLKQMKKGITADKVKKVFGICHKYKLRSLANFMINTPTETEDDLKATFSLADEIRATKYNFAVTVPLLGTEIYKEYVHPELTREEYAASGERRAYQGITDSRFRMAQHSRNMSLLYIWARAKYMIYSEYMDSICWCIRNYKFYKKSIWRKSYYRIFCLIYINKTYTLFKRLIERIFKFQYKE